MTWTELKGSTGSTRRSCSNGNRAWVPITGRKADALARSTAVGTIRSDPGFIAMLGTSSPWTFIPARRVWRSLDAEGAIESSGYRRIALINIPIEMHDSIRIDVGSPVE